jgi:hypothetical protein
MQMTTFKVGDRATTVYEGVKHKVTITAIRKGGLKAEVEFDSDGEFDDVKISSLKRLTSKKTSDGKTKSGIDLSNGGFTENRGALTTIRADMKAALADVEAKFGVRFDLNGSMSYQADQFSMRVVCAIPSLNTAKRDNDLAMMAKSYNLDLKKTSFDGFKLVGFNARARARPWVVRKVSTGKEYIMRYDAVEARFGKTKNR